VDFVVAGPVRATASHPDRRPLGWDEFSSVIANTPVPSYALGGLQAADLLNAMRHGAHGIASRSAVWNDDQRLGDDALLAGSSVSTDDSATDESKDMA
jgi:thiamine monophosphate synthase